MTQFIDAAMENNINLDDCVIFIKDDDEILAVNTKYVGIKQRQDTTMSFNFSITPKEVKNLEIFFEKFHTGEKFYYDISRTGYRPVYFRGLSPVIKQAESDKFNISLIIQPAIVEPKDNYFEPSCECCTFHHIE